MSALSVEERLEALLAGRAVGDLSRSEQRELDNLLSEDDDERFELAMAAVDLAMMNNDNEPMPERLRASVQQEAFAYFERERRDGRKVVPTTTTGANVVPLDNARLDRPSRHSKGGFSVAEWKGPLTLAACLALVGAGWLLRESVEQPPTVASTSNELSWEAKGTEHPLSGRGGSLLWRGGDVGGELYMQGLRSTSEERYHVWMLYSNGGTELVATFDAAGVDEARVQLRADGRTPSPRGALVTLQAEMDKPAPDTDAIVLTAGQAKLLSNQEQRAGAAEPMENEPTP